MKWQPSRDNLARARCKLGFKFLEKIGAGNDTDFRNWPAFQI